MFGKKQFVVKPTTKEEKTYSEIAKDVQKPVEEVSQTVDNKQQTGEDFELSVDNMEESVNKLQKMVNKLAANMERINFQEYVEYLNKPWKMLLKSFTNGIARGIGFAIGFALLGAILIVILQSVSWRNIPIVGDFIQEIVAVVEDLVKNGVK